jgi:hypothetical protein
MTFFSIQPCKSSIACYEILADVEESSSEEELGAEEVKMIKEIYNMQIKQTYISDEENESLEELKKRKFSGSSFIKTPQLTNIRQTFKKRKQAHSPSFSRFPI